MKKISLFALALGLLLFTSCAKHIYVDYQNEATNTGTLVIKPSKPTQRTFVTINDSLVVDRKFAKSVSLKNVPEGAHVINYTSENSWYKDKLNAEIVVKLDKGREITKLVEVPPYSTGYWIYVTGSAIVGALIAISVN